MSESRQPEDLKRFKLELTKDGPRFVLSTGEQAAVAPEAQERAPVPESPSEAPVSSVPAAEAAPVSAASDAAVEDTPPQAVADVPAASPVRPASPPKKGHARKLPPVKKPGARRSGQAPVAPSTPPPAAPVVKASTPPPAPAAPVVKASTPPPAPAPVVKASTPPPAPAAPVVKASTPPPAPVAPVAKASTPPPAPAAPVVKASTPPPAGIVKAGPAPAPASAAKRPLDITPGQQDAPTETHTVLDSTNSERLPGAFWKAALPPQAVAADYTVEAGIERVHAPVASPHEAVGLLREAEAAADEEASRATAAARRTRSTEGVRLPRVLISALAAAAVMAVVFVKLTPSTTKEENLVTRPDRAATSRARLATSNASRLFARGLDGALQKALESGLYVVVSRKDDGTMSNENIVEDLMSRDLESAQKLARIKSETLGQPLFIIARRDGDVAIVDRVNPGDARAWRDYSMNVWYLKQHALSWSRERYMSREALDPKQTLATMSDFVRSHPDSRVVGAALEDMRYICYFNLQDPSKFRAVALGLLDDALKGFDRQRGGSVPELVYVMKPYLKEAENQFIYERIHRITAAQQASMRATSDSGEALLSLPPLY